MADVPSSGVPWTIFTPIQRSNIEYWSGVYGIPTQALMNMLWRESGVGDIAAGTGRLDPNSRGSSPQIQGIAQIHMGNTGPGLGVTNAMDDGQAIMGLAHAMRIYGTGGTIGNNLSETREGTRPFDLNRGIVFYNWGPGDPRASTPTRGRAWEASGRDNSILPAETRTYLENVLRGSGVAPPSVGTQGERSGAWTDVNEARNWRLNDEALGFLGPGGQVRTDEAWGVNPVGDFWRMQQGPSGTLGRAPAWETPGIIDPEYGHYLQTQGLMPANLQPTGGTDFTNTTWTGVPGSQPGWWGPWGAENVHNWAQEGISHGYGDPIMSMLGNLNYNLVDPGLPPGSPPLGGQPAPIGPTTGLPGAATGGVDLAHWLAQQWGSAWGSANAMDRPSNVYNAGNMFPQDMPLPWDRNAPQIQTWDAHPDLTFWDATRGPGVHTIDQPSGTATPGGQINVWSGESPNWMPAGGTWGTPGGVSPLEGWTQNQQDMFYNPYTNNWGTLTDYSGSPSNLFNTTGPNAGQHGSWSPFSGYTGPTHGDFPTGIFASPIEQAGGGGANMPVDAWGRVQQNTVPNAPIPSIKSWGPPVYGNAFGPSVYSNYNTGVSNNTLLNSTNLGILTTTGNIVQPSGVTGGTGGFTYTNTGNIVPY